MVDLVILMQKVYRGWHQWRKVGHLVVCIIIVVYIIVVCVIIVVCIIIVVVYVYCCC